MASKVPILPKLGCFPLKIVGFGGIGGVGGELKCPRKRLKKAKNPSIFCLYFIIFLKFLFTCFNHFVTHTFTYFYILAINIFLQFYNLNL